MACAEQRTPSCPTRRPTTTRPKRWNRQAPIPDSHPHQRCHTRSRPSHRPSGHSPKNPAFRPKGHLCQQGPPATRSTNALPHRTADGSDTPQQSRSAPQCSQHPRRPSTPLTQSQGCRQPGLHEPTQSRRSQPSSPRRHRSPDRYQ